MSYEEYLKEKGINKNKPVKIEYSPIDRLHYCPTCYHFVRLDEKECATCEQRLISPYKFV